MFHSEMSFSIILKPSLIFLLRLPPVLPPVTPPLGRPPPSFFFVIVVLIVIVIIFIVLFFRRCPPPLRSGCFWSDRGRLLPQIVVSVVVFLWTDTVHVVGESTSESGLVVQCVVGTQEVIAGTSKTVVEQLKNIIIIMISILFKIVNWCRVSHGSSHKRNNFNYDYILYKNIWSDNALFMNLEFFDGAVHSMGDFLK